MRLEQSRDRDSSDLHNESSLVTVRRAHQIGSIFYRCIIVIRPAHCNWPFNLTNLSFRRLLIHSIAIFRISGSTPARSSFPRVPSIMTNVQLVSISFQSAGGRLLSLNPHGSIKRQLRRTWVEKTRPPHNRWIRAENISVTCYCPLPWGQVKANKNPFRCERDFFFKKKKKTNRDLVVPLVTNITQPDHVVSFFKKKCKFIRIETTFHDIKDSQVMEFTCRNGSVVSLRKLSVLVVAAFILFVTRRLFFLFLFLLISTFHRFGSVDHHSCQPVTSTLVVIKTDVTIKWQTTALPSHRQTQIC